MPTPTPLLIDLAGVARLADVRRPVASVWRSRSASSADPFPEPVGGDGGRPLFDVVSIAQWLARTGRGNNPDVVADAAASGAPPGFDFSDPVQIAAVDALLTLGAAAGAAIGGFGPDELREHAMALDPDDTCLASEVLSADPAWAEWADRLADAAYSSAQASRLLEARHSATKSVAGTAGPLTSDGEALLGAVAAALMVGNRGELVVHDGIAPSLATELVTRLGEDVDVVVPPLGEGRSIRRRLLLDERGSATTSPTGGASRLYVARYPSDIANTASGMLEAVDELVLGMRDDDRAVVVGPAAVLVDAINGAAELVRADVLRSGRVRAIVRLPAGLVTAAPRAALALWVFGRETGEVPLADRVTAVADLTGTPLTAASRADLTSDVLAAMGSARDVRSHRFRFTRLVRTPSLLASPGGLVVAAANARRDTRPARDLPALLDQAYVDLGDDAPPLAPASTPGPSVASASVEQLRAERHLRLLPGTRLLPEQISLSGLVVVGAQELDDPARVGGRRVDPLVFAAQHPSARLTMAGDVVFRTAPTAKAWVDPDGSKIVAHPARVLRIEAADPGGLVPELVAADIATSRGGPAAWRRWQLRRVAPGVASALRMALSDLTASRAALIRRAEALDDYAELLVAAVVSGAVTLTDPAVDTASDPQ